MQKPVVEAIKNDNARKNEAMAEASRVLDLAYGWLEQRLEGRTWAAGETMSLADCAAAPSLVACKPTAMQTSPSRQNAMQHPRRNDQQERSECRGQLPPIK